jgi:hypothetical protein
MPNSDKFRGDLTEEDMDIIEDALEQSKAFKVYGDGREEHQKKIDIIIKKLYKFWEVK